MKQPAQTNAEDATGIRLVTLVTLACLMAAGLALALRRRGRRSVPSATWTTDEAIPLVSG